MKEEKENLILKFFGYFIGPIQFVMEVSFTENHDLTGDAGGRDRIRITSVLPRTFTPIETILCQKSRTTERAKATPN